jgi:hypothetical protein
LHLLAVDQAAEFQVVGRDQLGPDRPKPG